MVWDSTLQLRLGRVPACRASLQRDHIEHFPIREGAEIRDGSFCFPRALIRIPWVRCVSGAMPCGRPLSGESVRTPICPVLRSKHPCGRSSALGNAQSPWVRLPACPASAPHIHLVHTSATLTVLGSLCFPTRSRLPSKIFLASPRSQSLRRHLRGKADPECSI
jgi:hypothetical protein